MESYKVITEIISTARHSIAQVEDKNGNRFIIKILQQANSNDNTEARLANELNLTKDLQTKGVLKGVKIERHSDKTILYLENIMGVSLDIKYGKTSPPVDEWVDIFLDLAKTIGQVHSEGIIHKDLNPANIIKANDSNRCYIIDFGVASRANIQNKPFSTEGKLEGTMQYIPPEQTGRIDAEVSFAADIYSLGITMYFLALRELPFDSNDHLELIHSHLAKEATPLHVKNPKFPISISRIVSKCMHKDPVDRYQSGLGLYLDLKAAKEQDTDFKLGSKDFSVTFDLPKRFLNRNQEMNKVEKAWHAVGPHQSHFINVYGEKGIGRSEFCNQITKLRLSRDAHIWQVEFKEQSSAEPFAELGKAFAQWIEKIILLPLEERERWKKNIKKAIEPHAQFFAEISPNIEQIIGQQPNAPYLNPNKKQSLLHIYWQNLTDLMCKQPIPFVFIIDDYQFADKASKDFIQSVAKNQKIRNLLLVRAFSRDSREPLPQEKGEFIELKPLRHEDVGYLCSELLRKNQNECSDFCDWIYKLSKGNPFYISQIVESLANNNLLSIDIETGSWSYSMKSISNLPIGGDLSSLLIARIESLTEEVKNELHKISIVGYKCPLNFVESILDSSTLSSYSALQYILSTSGIMSIADGHFFFTNFQIRDLLYKRTANAVKAEVHLKYAQYLTSQLTKGELRTNERQKIIKACSNHYRHSNQAVWNSNDKKFALKFTLEAGSYAYDDLAYNSAIEFYRFATEMLGENGWIEHYKLTWQTHRSLIDLAYLSSDFDLGDAYLDQTLPKCRSKLDQGELVRLKVLACASANRYREAIDLGIETLAKFGVHFNFNTSSIRVAYELIALKVKLSKYSIDDLRNLPLCSDAEQIFIIELTAALASSIIIIGNDNLSAVQLLKMVSLTLDYGNSTVAPAAYAAYSVVCVGVLKDYKAGDEFVTLAEELCFKLNEFQHLGQVRFVQGLFVYPWTRPMSLALQKTSKGYTDSLTHGDLAYASYCVGTIAQIAFCFARDCKEIARAADDYKTFSIQSSQPDRLKDATVFSKYNEFFQKTTHVDIHKDIDAYLKSYLAHDLEPNSQNMFSLIHLKMMTLLGEYEKAWECVVLLDRNIKISMGMFYFSEHFLLSAIVSSALHRNNPRNTKYKKNLKKNIHRLKKLAKLNQSNFQCYYLFSLAELDVVLEKPFQAIGKFLQAADLSKKADFLFHQALAMERAGSLYLNHGHHKAAQVVLQESYDIFRFIGIKIKLSLLKASYPEVSFESIVVNQEGAVATTSETSVGSNNYLDLASAIKAATAISEEIYLSDLLAKLVDVLIENAGAEACAILLKNADGKNEKYYVQAFSKLGETPSIMDSLPLEQCEYIPHSIIERVIESKKELILSDLNHLDHFLNDPYLISYKPKSIVCLPIIGRGMMIGVLYLENRLISGIFTESKLSLLSMISSQAAVSIENSVLYKNMEEKIELRTKELSEKTREIQVMLSSLRQGIFIIESNGMVHPEYSAYLEEMIETKDIAHKPYQDAIFANFELRSDKKNRMKQAIDSAMGESMISFRINEQHLPKELYIANKGRTLDVAWDPIVDENGVVEKIMVSLRDVTELRQLRARANRQHAEAVMISEIIALPASKFESYLATTKKHCAKCESLLDHQPEDTLKGLIREVHTIKGNSRIYHISFVSDLAHQFEEVIKKAASLPLSDVSFSLRGCLDKILNKLDQYEEIYKSKLSRTKPENERMSIHLDSYNLLKEAFANKKDLKNATSAIIREESEITLTRILKNQFAEIKHLASSLGKEEPNIKLEGKTLWFKKEDQGWLTDIFGHIFRNSLDHGIEDSKERIQSGKASNGTIHIRMEQSTRHKRIKVWDDGRGLDMEKLRQKNKEGRSDKQKIAELILESGVSTADQVTDISGRGVGMDAVREFIRQQGGELRIELMQESAKFCPFILILDLPVSASDL